MTVSAARVADTQSRHARIAVAALFFTNGALFANLLPRYPEIKAALELSNSSFGLAVAAFPVGAMVSGLAAGVLIRRFGSARVAVAGTFLTAVGVLAAAIAPSFILFAAGLFLGGAMDSITDVAQNAHGLRVQRRYGRSILNSFHAVWSIGAATGGVMAAGAIALDLDLLLHLTISGILFTAVALVALKFCLPGPESEPAPQNSSTTTPTTIARAAARPLALTMAALVLIAVAGALVEDAGNSWAALYLSNDLGAAAGIAATGYISMVGAQFIGRMLGDRMVDRFGQRAVARAGGVIVLIGMGTALAFPSLVGTILGFAAAGFGVATLVPAAMHEADELPGLRPGTGLTVLTWLMRMGFLFSPPLVGLIADHAGLRVGLLTIPLAGIVVIVLAGVLSPKRS